MKLRWTESQLKYFNKPISVTKADYDWVVWAILAVCSLTGLAYLIFGVAR